MAISPSTAAFRRVRLRRREPRGTVVVDLVRERRQPDAVLARGLAQERAHALLGVDQPPVAGHRAGRVEHEHHVRRLAILAPVELEPRQHPRRGRVEHPPRLPRICPVVQAHRGHGPGVHVRGPEAGPRGDLRRDRLGEEPPQRLRALALLGRHPVPFEDDERVVGVERALARVDRRERRLALAVAVEVQQRGLLHRHRRRVARAAGAHLVGDEERRVAVVDDRALEIAHDRPRAGGRHVALGEAMALAGGGEVLRHHRLEPRGREVGVGVDELEGAPLRVAEVTPAGPGARQPDQVAEADRLAGQPSARAIGSHIAITSGVRTIDGFAAGTSRRSASNSSRLPHSDEAGDHATGRRLPSRDPRLGLAGGDDLASTNTGRPPSLAVLRVEALERAGRAASPSRASRRTRRAAPGRRRRARRAPRPTPRRLARAAKAIATAMAARATRARRPRTPHLRSPCRRTRPSTSATAARRARFWFCGSVFEPEPLEQHAQVGLDGVHAEVDLGGDLPVARRRGVRRVLQRPAEADQHAALGLRQRQRGVSRGDRHGRHRGVVGRRVEHDARVAEATSRSPSRSRRRPATRSPLTHVPLRERPSSTSDPVAAERLELRRAARETSPSQGSATALPSAGRS